MGQLYEELGKKDSALLSFQSVIDMHRKADREYVIQAYAKKAQLFDFQMDSIYNLNFYTPLLVYRWVKLRLFFEMEIDFWNWFFTIALANLIFIIF